MATETEGIIPKHSVNSDTELKEKNMTQQGRSSASLSINAVTQITSLKLSRQHSWSSKVPIQSGDGREDLIRAAKRN